MSTSIRLRDAFRSYVPRFLSDRPGKNVGFRFLWTMIAPLDVAAQVLVEGIQAAQPGYGTPSALPLIGRTRGILRGLVDTDAVYAARLRRWLEAWREAGSSYELARQIQAYLGTSPRVRVITRSGIWVTLDPNGTITKAAAAWDWDSLSHPERAGFWSELFIVIEGALYAKQLPWGAGNQKWGTREGWGHRIPSEQGAELRSLMQTWKSAHSRIRAVIWTPTAAAHFIPGNAGSCPDGTWGAWGTTGNGPRVASNRFTDCRYWEF